jgi:hypothetical protein
MKKQKVYDLKSKAIAFELMVFVKIVVINIKLKTGNK